MLEDSFMSNEYRHVELLTGDVRRRRWTTEQKLTIIEQSLEPGETVSSSLAAMASRPMCVDGASS
jgi:Transposase